MRKNQYTFLRYLNEYINSGCFSKKDLLISILSRTIPFLYNAGKIVNLYLNLKDSTGNSLISPSIIRLEPYQGKNIHVWQMIEFLDSHLRSDLIGAYVHGSLATYEEIPFSDFDALVIIKDEVFQSRRTLVRVGEKLNDALSIMFSFDPLQHHGWFVITELDLRSYPEYYFPSEILRYAKSLIPETGHELKINTETSSDLETNSFYEITTSIISRLQKKQYPQNIYQLKSLLSQFMLMPSLYLQARNNKGVFKRFSFDQAKMDFTGEEWTIMDEVSSVRKNWSYEISPFMLHLINRPAFVSRMIAKRFSPQIPDSLSSLLSEQFFERMICLAVNMRGKVQ